MGEYRAKPTPPKELADFPALSQKELDTVEWRFNHYLFFENEKAGRWIWTTCCHKKGFVEKQGRTSTPADRIVLSAGHNRYVTCPYCGRVVYTKNRKLLRRGVKLTEYHAVVFLHVAEDANTVWAQGYWTTRDLMNDPAGPVLYKPTRVYRFQPGKAEQWDIGWKDHVLKRKHYRILEPCMDNGVAPYIPVGLERLQHSFLKYTGYEDPIIGYDKSILEMKGIRDDLIRYLAAAARYPRQVELMRKAGLTEALTDLVYKWKKNADVLKWNETDPCKAFGLTKPELKEFLAGDKNLDTLRVLKKVRAQGGRMTITEADSLRKCIGMNMICRILERTKEYRIPVNALLKYLDSFTGPRCHGMGVTLRHVVGYWGDYIDMADQCGYDLSNPIWQMPKDLEDKHDRLAEAVNATKKELVTLEEKQRLEKAEKKYNFEADGWIIRVAIDGDEIAEEGKALKHCVGGYADRHMYGVLTILFLRRADAPCKSYVTIEMQGNKLIQIHGYKNEREACPENPNKIPPRQTHKKLLDTWMDWVQKGSKRHEDGSPILPKQNIKQKERKTA